MEKITKELINELMNSKNIAGFTSENALEFEDLLLTDYLSQMLKKYGKTKIDVIKGARLDYTYGYQIFDGRRKPKREKLLQLAFGFSMSVEDANRLLRAGGVNDLYVRSKRDVICMYALQQKMTLEECNMHLYQMGEETLLKEDCAVEDAD
ncbi:MAG: hypothetical protein E7260_06120 [Lachnospiraceae bacterium]|nr:hypothetical protein [Lachnospiraceae bacterium]